MKNKLTIIILMLPLLGWGQQWQHVFTIDLKKPISSYSIDNEGKIYLGTESGDLYRYLPDGKEDIHFSGIANSPLTTTEAWNRFKVFLFYRDIQKFSILDRFSTTPVDYDLQSFQSDLAWLTTPGVDNSFWVLSTAYNELRKFNLQSRSLVLTTPLSADLKNASHMRTIQNLIIISDMASGLYFFDQYGNLAERLPITGLRHFDVKDRVLAGLAGRDLIALDPFNPKPTLKTIKAPEGAFKGVLTVKDLYFFIGDTGVFIYKKKS